MKKIVKALYVLLIIFGVIWLGISIYYAVKVVPYKAEIVDFYMFEHPNTDPKVMELVTEDLIKRCIEMCAFFLSSGVMITLFIILSPKLFRKSTYTSLVDKLSTEWKITKEEHYINKQQTEITKKREQLKILQEELEDIDIEDYKT